MNLTELKSEFEILFEEMATAGSKGLDDYEISVCFTNAQEQIVESILSSYEYGDRMRHILKPLLLRYIIPKDAFAKDIILPYNPYYIREPYLTLETTHIYTAGLPNTLGEYRAAVGGKLFEINSTPLVLPALDYQNVQVGDTLIYNSSTEYTITGIEEKDDGAIINFTVKESITAVDEVDPVPIQFRIETDKFKEGILKIVYEFLNITNNDFIPVIPMDTNDIHYTIENPFREPNENIAYRTTAEDNFYLYTSDDSFVEYGYIYCKYPDPVVLEGVTEEINGQVWANGNPPVLPENFQRKLVEAAVQFAIKVYVGMPERIAGQRE